MGLLTTRSLIILTLLLSIAITATAQQDQAAVQIPSDGTLRRIKVPILMYHYVSELPQDADDYRINLTLSPQLFAQHLEYFAQNGYTLVSLYEVNQALAYGTPLPEKPVVLTFDDGYIDHYTTVYPLLRQYNGVGTFFIITDFADNNQSGYVSWEQIEEMHQNGMEIESHTKSHADLRNRSYDFLVYQILGSIESLNAHLSQKTSFFAYPVGHYDDNTLNVLATIPIQRAVTTQMGIFLTSDNLYELPRLRITNETGVEGLKYLLQYNR